MPAVCAALSGAEELAQPLDLFDGESESRREEFRSTGSLAEELVAS